MPPIFVRFSVLIPFIIDCVHVIKKISQYFLPPELHYLGQQAKRIRCPIIHRTKEKSQRSSQKVLSRIHGVQQKPGGKAAVKDSKAGLCDKKHDIFERVAGLAEKMSDFLLILCWFFAKLL